MRYLSDELIKEANAIDSDMRGHIYCLDRIGFYGTEEKNSRNVERIANFLSRRKIGYERNNRYSIWLDSLPEVLKAIFRKP